MVSRISKNVQGMINANRSLRRGAEILGLVTWSSFEVSFRLHVHLLPLLLPHSGVLYPHVGTFSSAAILPTQRLWYLNLVLKGSGQLSSCLYCFPDFSSVLTLLT